MNNRILLREIKKLRKESAKQSRFTRWFSCNTLILSVSIAIYAISLSFRGNSLVFYANIWEGTFWIIILIGIPIFNVMFHLTFYRKKR